MTGFCTPSFSFSTWKGRLPPRKSPSFPTPVIPGVCGRPKTQTPGWLVFSAASSSIPEAVQRMTPSCSLHYPQGPGQSHLLIAKNTTLPVGPTGADSVPVELKWSIIIGLLLPCLVLSESDCTKYIPGSQLLFNTYNCFNLLPRGRGMDLMMLREFQWPKKPIITQDSDSGVL